MEKFVEVVPDQSTLIERSLEIVLEKILNIIEVKGKCTIVLSGGSTPKPLYEAISHQNIPWDKIYIFWGDERYVSPNHPDSNQKMAREAWLNKVNIPAENIFPLRTLAENPEYDAQFYQIQLENFFELQKGEFPVFDIILLGMGDDGHTASLFPYTDALKVSDRLVTVGNKNGEPRLTLTIPVINHGENVIFIVAGENKQIALDEIFSVADNGETYPAKLIQPKGELWWLLDQAAGVKLKSKE
jgi:6-phosphogluconolactonase